MSQNGVQLSSAPSPSEREAATGTEPREAPAAHTVPLPSFNVTPGNVTVQLPLGRGPSQWERDEVDEAIEAMVQRLATPALGWAALQEEQEPLAEPQPRSRSPRRSRPANSVDLPHFAPDLGGCGHN